MKNTHTHTHALKKEPRTTTARSEQALCLQPPLSCGSQRSAHSAAPQPSRSRTVGAALGQISHPAMSSAGSPRSNLGRQLRLPLPGAVTQLRIPAHRGAPCWQRGAAPALSGSERGAFPPRSAKPGARCRRSKGGSQSSDLVAAEQFASLAWLPTELRAALRCAALSGSSSPPLPGGAVRFALTFYPPKAAPVHSVLSCCRDNPLCKQSSHSRVLVLLEADEPCRAVPCDAQVIFC